MQKDLLRLSIISAMVITVGFSAPALASNQQYNDFTPAVQQNHFYVAVHGGATYRFIKKKIDVSNSSTSADESYNLNGTSNTLFDFGIRGGWMKHFNAKTYLQLGAGYYRTGQQGVTGEFDQEADGVSDFDFAFNLNTQRLMGEMRLYRQAFKHVGIFIGGGAGVAQLQTSAAEFTLKPDSAGWESTPLSKPKTYNQAVYSATGGLDFPITNRLDLELGVRHDWLGNMKISVNSDTKYRDISVGSLTPTTFWLELGLRF